MLAWRAERLRGSLRTLARELASLVSNSTGSWTIGDEAGSAVLERSADLLRRYSSEQPPWWKESEDRAKDLRERLAHWGRNEDEGAVA